MNNIELVFARYEEFKKFAKPIYIIKDNAITEILFSFFRLKYILKIK